MNDTLQSAKLVGFVQLHIGSRMIALPIQSLPFQVDEPGKSPGGFFVAASGQCGILVNETTSQNELEQQILVASVDAVRHLSQKVLN